MKISISGAVRTVPGWQLSSLVRPKFGGDLASTGLVGGCRRAEVVRDLVNKPGKTLIGEFDYAMAA